MGFMDKVKSTTSGIVGQGQAKLDSVQAKRQADELLRVLGLLVYNEQQGRAPAEQASHVETTITKLRDIESMHPDIFVPQAGSADASAVGAMAPPAGSFIPGSEGNVGTSQVDYSAGVPGQPAYAPPGQPAYAAPGAEQMPAPAYAPQPGAMPQGMPQPMPGGIPQPQPAPGFEQPFAGAPQGAPMPPPAPAPGFAPPPPPGAPGAPGAFIPTAPPPGVPGMPQAAPFDPAAASQGVPAGGFIPTGPGEAPPGGFFPPPEQAEEFEGAPEEGPPAG
jgi:hypothetical protein